MLFYWKKWGQVGVYPGIPKKTRILKKWYFFIIQHLVMAWDTNNVSGIENKAFWSYLKKFENRVWSPKRVKIGAFLTFRHLGPSYMISMVLLDFFENFLKTRESCVRNFKPKELADKIFKYLVSLCFGYFWFDFYQINFHWWP